MTAGHLLPADLSKEVRALLPVWLACVVVVWAGGYDDPFLFRAGFLTYMLGSAALGALSIGHEYTHRTLPFLLSTPISRRRILAMKASALLPMLLILAAIAQTRLPVTPLGHEMEDTALLGLLFLLCSAFLAPWLTIVCRNPIAGAVFVLSIPSALLLASEFGAIAVYGVGQVDTPMFQRLRMEILWGGMALVLVIGAVSTWRAFMRLETIEGSQSELRLPRVFSRPWSPARVVSQRLHPVWSLVRKEIRLQELTFVVSMLYVCGWIATLGVRAVAGTGVNAPLLILTVVHGIVVALLSGALASAEERHLGVLESQLLLPMSTARQWAIKSAVVFGVCGLLTTILPLALMVGSRLTEQIGVNVPFVVVVFVGTAVGLYVSSVSNSGVKALLLCGPVFMFLGVMIPALGESVLWVARLSGIPRPPDAFRGGFMAVISVLAAVLLLRFALTNHRSSDRPPFRLWRQLLWLSAAVTCAMLVAVVAAR